MTSRVHNQMPATERIGKWSALIVVLLVAGCSQTNTPVGIIPAPTPTPSGVKFPLAPYQDMLDTLYFKVWSDSSWIEYGGTKVIGTSAYIVMKDNLGDEYYYDSLGYAGFYNPGSQVILFDTPLGAWPDSLQINGQFNESTTFSYQGYSWTIYDTYNLADTSSASATVGTFDPCLHLQYMSTIYVAGSGNSSYEDIWLANGPGEIVQEDASGGTIVMARGHVNGRYWGTGVATAAPGRALAKSGPENLLRIVSAGLRANIRLRRVK